LQYLSSSEISIEITMVQCIVWGITRTAGLAVSGGIVSEEIGVGYSNLDKVGWVVLHLSPCSVVSRGHRATLNSMREPVSQVPGLRSGSGCRGGTHIAPIRRRVGVRLGSGGSPGS